jgi:hypothetical protein
MNKQTHPVKIHTTGGLHAWDSEQETPHVMLGAIEYADGSIIDWKVGNLYSPAPARGTILYTTEGYVVNRGGWKAMRGRVSIRPITTPASRKPNTRSVRGAKRVRTLLLEGEAAI